MQSDQPPRLATWLLRHFGCGRDNESVLGDLAEQYRERRSQVWYWRQVLSAIALSVSEGIVSNKVRSKMLLATTIMLGGGILKARHPTHIRVDRLSI